MRRSKGETAGMVLFLVPALALFIMFFIYPVGFVAATSLFKWDGMSAPLFVGMQNFINIFKDPTFRISIRNNILWALMGGLIQVPLAMMVALFLARKPKGWKTLRTIYFLPNIISGVAMAMMWAAIYNSEYGLLNGILKLVGLGNLQRNWLGDLNATLPAVLIYWVFYIGYFMVIILAEISSIPETYYEAASIDGASRFQQDIHITMPLIKGSVSTCMTLAMIYGLRQFEQVYMLTNGGPANTTSVMVLYMYKQLQNYNYGVADTSAIVLMLIGSIVIVTIRKLFSTEQYQM